MSIELQETVAKLGLQNPKVYIGRERLFPTREGLVPSPEAIATLKQALSDPESVKSSVKIMDGDLVAFKSAKGLVEVPLRISEQAQSAIRSEAAPEALPTVPVPVAEIQKEPEP
ncbi:MAG: hypothetical protein WCD18_26340, partial [Thermosynechococcaceae cyanobacterium]